MTDRSSSLIGVDPMISVIIPCFNYGRFLNEAVQSVLDQTYSHTEIIIVDDGSSDDTSSVAAALGPEVKYVYQENQGIGAARNTGIKMATGQLFSFLDADDHWSRNKLRWQLDMLQSNGDVDIVYGKAKQYYSPEVSEDFKRCKGFKQEIIRATLSTAILISRELFMKVGYFSSWVVAVDQEWYMRAVDMGLKIHTLDEIVYFRRIHENNNGIIADRKEESGRLHVLKESLDRRRKNS